MGTSYPGGGAGDPATATTTAAGVAELATEAEVETGTDTGRVITPSAIVPAAMSWTGEHTWDKPTRGLHSFHQRGGFAPPDDNASLEGWGLFGAITEVTSDLLSGGLDAGGKYWEQITLALANESAFIHTSRDVTRLSYNPSLLMKFSLRATTNERFFVGLSEDNTVFTSDTPTGTYIGIKYSTATSDTNFELIHENTTLTTVDTSVAVDTDPHFFYLRADTASSVFVALLDNTGAVEFSTTVTTELPGSTTPLSPRSGLYTTTTEIKTMAHYLGELVNRI